MGWIPVVLGAIAAWRVGRVGHPFLFWFALASATLCLWSFGVMHNFAYGAAASRRAHLLENFVAEGRSADDIARLRAQPIRMSPGDRKLAPNWATAVNMLATALAALLFIAAWFV